MHLNRQRVLSYKPMPAPSKKDILTDITAALQSFRGGAQLYDSSIALLNTLGYRSQKTQRLSSPTFEGFKEMFSIGGNAIKRDKALIADWQRIDFLFQLGDTEVSGISSLFDAYKPNKDEYQSFLFTTIELKGREYKRAELVAITRELNKPFYMPVIVLFYYDGKLTFSIIDRRLHKRDSSKDVLEKVTLIKDITLANPHRAHLHILDKLSLHSIPAKTFGELLQAWKNVLNIRELNDAFYKDLSAWYYYAINHIKLPVRPAYIKSDADNIKAFTVRLICRTIFSWFLKERGLIDKELLELYDVLENPKGLLDGESTKAFLKQNSYYRAILQNIFFAALNTPMEARSGKKAYYGKPYLPSSFDYDAFAKIPFLNGGLFDRLEEDNYNERIEDGALKVPNELFYGKELIIAEGKKSKSTQGLNRILSQYVFTIDENTPLEEEVALDPELLGHVFENLLAEIGDDEAAAKSARKASGSYYTPRRIIDYMVNESLLLYLQKCLMPFALQDSDRHLRNLVYYNKLSDDVADGFCAAVVEALDNLRMLDPACGSGAFPMGALNRIVALLKIVDEDNSLWIAKQVKRLPSELRKQARADFGRHNLDYARKLGLIRNCIYGLDIQPTAVMISKLRFFISLLVEQKITDDRTNNYGISPLPHLETKIICADSLQDIGAGSLFNQHLYEAVKEARETLYATGSTNEEREEATQKIAETIYELYPFFGEKVTGNKYNDERSKRGQNLELIRRWLRNAAMPAPFFSPDVFFPELSGKGFHIVMGNPPYGGTDIPDGVKTALGLASKDPYGAFIARFLSGRKGSPLADGGLLAYIVSDTFMTIKSHLPLRRQLMVGLLHKAIRVHPDTFKATVNTCILIAERIAQDALSEQPLRLVPKGHHVMMADLTPVNIHEHYERFLEILYQTQTEHNKAVQVSSPEYAIYHYPQNVIRHNSNLPFFAASPKLFGLMDDCSEGLIKVEVKLGKEILRARVIKMNGQDIKVVKLGEIADVKQGLATGDNSTYLFQNSEARGNYQSIDDYKEYLLTDKDLERIRRDDTLRMEVIERGINKTNTSSRRYFGGRYIVPFDKGGESDAGEGWMPNYFVRSDYYLDWSEWAVKRMHSYTIAQRMKDYKEAGKVHAHYHTTTCAVIRNSELYFKPGITFSPTGVYAPTFRINCIAIFGNKGSTIFSSEAVDVTNQLAVLNSKIFRFLFKNFRCHTVENPEGQLSEASIFIQTSEPLKSLVAQIIERQKKNPRYDYARAEQVEIDRLVYEAYGLIEEDILEVEHWYARRYPRLAAHAAKKSVSQLSSPANPDILRPNTAYDGIYSIQDVVRITQLSSARIKRWFDRLVDSSYEGIQKDYRTPGEPLLLNFYGVHELMVIQNLVEQNKIPLQDIFDARKWLQERFGKSYPFATEVVLRTIASAGAQIIFHDEASEDYLTLGKGNAQLNLVFIREILKRIVFDKEMVGRLYLSDTKLIAIDPELGSGRPCTVINEVQLEMIKSMFQATPSVGFIAQQYEISEAAVEDALKFEKAVALN